MSVAACQFCIWCKELLGPLLFLLKPWLNVHWHAGTWVPSFVYEFHVIPNLSLLLLLFVNLQLWVPCGGGTVRSLSRFTCSCWHSTRGRSEQLEVENISPNQHAAESSLMKRQPWRGRFAQSVGDQILGVQNCHFTCYCCLCRFHSSVSLFQFSFGTAFFFLKDVQSSFCFYPPVLIHLCKVKKGSFSPILLTLFVHLIPMSYTG